MWNLVLAGIKTWQDGIIFSLEYADFYRFLKGKIDINDPDIENADVQIRF